MSLPGVEVRPGRGTRTLRPGPKTGYYELITFSVGSVASGAIAQPQFYLGSHARVVAVGWYARSISGGTGTTFEAGNSGGPTTAPLSTSILTAPAAIDGLTSGVYRTLGTTPLLDADRVRSGAAGSPLWLRLRLTAGTNTVLDASMWMLLWRTGHTNVDRALD